MFADWLRSPTADREAGAERAISDLQASLGPVLGGALLSTAAPDPAQHDRYRQQARSALDDYFREHPIKPTKL